MIVVALPQISKPVSGEVSATSIVLAEVDQSLGISHQNSTFRRYHVPAHTEELQLQIEPSDTHAIFQGSRLKGDVVGSEMGIGREDPPSMYAPLTIERSSRDIHRCFKSGLGCLPEFSLGSKPGLRAR